MKWRYNRVLYVMTVVIFFCTWLLLDVYPLTVGSVLTSYLVTDLLNHPVRTIMIAALPLACALFWLFHVIEAYKNREETFGLKLPESIIVFVLAYAFSIFVMMFLARDYLFL